MSSHSRGKAAPVLHPHPSAKTNSRHTCPSRTAQSRLKHGTTQRSSLHLKQQEPPPAPSARQRPSTTWRDDLRVVRLSRQSRPCPASTPNRKNPLPPHLPLADGAVAPETWDDTEVIPPPETKEDTHRAIGAAAPIDHLEGRPPCRPTLAAKPPPSCIHTRAQNPLPPHLPLADGAVAPEAWDDTEVIPPPETTRDAPRFTCPSRTAQSRLRHGTTQRSSLHLKQQETPIAPSARQRPSKTWRDDLRVVRLSRRSRPCPASSPLQNPLPASPAPRRRRSRA